MSGEPHGAPRAPDKRKQPPTSFSVMPSQTVTYPPETPPMIDPAMMRYPRLTPNLRDMIHGFNQGLPDTSVPMNDLLASPDPTAMYNSLQIGSPILRDFYPAQSPSCGPYETPEPTERMSGACAEMNALFNYCPQGAATEQGYRPEGGLDGGVMSLMSSPEIRNRSVEISASGVSSSGQHNTESGEFENKKQASQTSSQTPPPVDSSSSSPSTSPEFSVKTEGLKKELRTETAHGTKPKKTASSLEKAKRPAVRPSNKTGSSGTRSASASASASATRLSPPAQLSVPTAASALAAANAVAMNPSMAGLMPFACAMPPGMGPHMLPAPGTVHYQGRPMAFVPGAHGTELIPVDMLAQATALQYGAAAQAAASRMMRPVGGTSAMPPRAVPPPFEAVVGSRKKRRRQLLERSGCSEEQARQNRAHALKRLRQKKTLRSQQSTVRYACRKRIAMVRPRVNGRFATKEEVEECRRTQN